MNKKIYISFLFLTIFSSLVISEDLRLKITGIGDTEANAVLDAQRNALRTSYGEFVSSNLTILNNELTKNETINLVSGTIKDFKVISKTVNDFSDPPITEVLLDVTVNRGQLVSFAKAIGDDVQVQGSLFGAEIRQQERNKENEAVALDHLLTRASQMSSFFDYELSVGTPQQSGVDTNNYIVASILKLTPNKNYTNFTSAVANTIKQISMDSEERKKFDNLNVPYYRLDIMNIKNGNCLNANYKYQTHGQDQNLFSNYPQIEARYGIIATRYSYDVDSGLPSFDDFLKKNRMDDYPVFTIPQNQMVIKKAERAWSHSSGVTSSIDSGYPGYNASCLGGMVERYYLRTEEARNILFDMNYFIFQSAMNYEVFRQTQTRKDVLIPRNFETPTWEVLNDVFRGDSNSYGRGREKLYEEFINISISQLIRRNASEEDKKKIKNDYSLSKGVYLSDASFSEYMRNAARDFKVGHLSPANFFQRQLGQGDLWTSASPPEETTDYSFERSLLPKSDPTFRGLLNRQSSIQLFHSKKIYNLNKEKLSLGSLGVVHIYPTSHVFAEILFEDVVSSSVLNSISAYVVDPDKPTKHQGLYEDLIEWKDSYEEIK